MQGRRAGGGGLKGIGRERCDKGENIGGKEEKQVGRGMEMEKRWKKENEEVEKGKKIWGPFCMMQ